MANYEVSEAGIARHAWIDKPDTKFNPTGLYHVELGWEGEAAERMVARFDELANDKDLVEACANRKGHAIKDWKKWKKEVLLPYAPETDDDGTPTGRVWGKFKQNAVIPLSDGDNKVFVMGKRDGANKVTKADCRSGSIIRVMWAPRIVPVASMKQFALRLDFCLVQIIKPAQAAGGRGFDEVEGAFVDDHDPGAPAGDGDY